MKTLLTASITLLALSLLGSAALAAPGDRRGDRYDDDYGYVDDYDEARTYVMPDFDRQVQRGTTFNQIRRHMRAEMNARVARNTRMIRARHGYTHRASRMISRMEARELQRFQSRLASAQARFERVRRVRYQSAPAYVPAPRYTQPSPRHRSGNRY